MLHHFYIGRKDKNSSSYLTASNCIIKMDGKELRGIRSLKFEIDAEDNNIAKLTLELLGSVEIDGNMDLKEFDFIKELNKI